VGRGVERPGRGAHNALPYNAGVAYQSGFAVCMLRHVFTQFESGTVKVRDAELRPAKRVSGCVLVHLITCNIYLERSTEQSRQCTYNVTLRRVRLTVVRVEEQ